MEIFARLENIEFHIKQLQSKCDSLQKENELLKKNNHDLNNRVETQVQELVNLEETNKISKLAHGTSTSIDNAAFKTQIDQLVKEI